MHLYLSLSLTLIIPVKPFSAMVGQSTCYSPIYSVNHTETPADHSFITLVFIVLKKSGDCGKP